MLARTRFVIHVHLHVDYTKTFAKGQSVSVLVRRFHDAFNAIVNVAQKK